MQESHRIELTVEGDTWNTLWLIQKAINEGDKKEVPLKIEIKSGSVETTISVAADVASIGIFVFEIVKYLLRKKELEIPLKIVKFSGAVACEYARYHLRTEVGVQTVELISENPTNNGGYRFEFEEIESPPRISGFRTRYIYTISKDFDVKYTKKEKWIHT